MAVGFVDTAENFHPYECDGPGKCVHCDRADHEDHDPGDCELCWPDLGDPDE
jgi:hypothetical protein